MHTHTHSLLAARTLHILTLSPSSQCNYHTVVGYVHIQYLPHQDSYYSQMSHTQCMMVTFPFLYSLLFFLAFKIAFSFFVCLVSWFLLNTQPMATLCQTLYNRATLYLLYFSDDIGILITPILKMRKLSHKEVE